MSRICMDCDNRICTTTNKDIKRCGRCSRLKREEHSRLKREEQQKLKREEQQKRKGEEE